MNVHCRRTFYVCECQHQHHHYFCVCGRNTAHTSCDIKETCSLQKKGNRLDILLSHTVLLSELAKSAGESCRSDFYHIHIIRLTSRSVLKSFRSLKAEIHMGGKEVYAEQKLVGEVDSNYLSNEKITYHYHCIQL